MIGRALVSARPMLGFFRAVRARLFWKGLGSSPARARGHNGRVPGGRAFELYPDPSLIQIHISHFKKSQFVLNFNVPKFFRNIWLFSSFLNNKSGVHFFIWSYFYFFPWWILNGHKPEARPDPARARLFLEGLRLGPARARLCKARVRPGSRFLGSTHH